MADVHRLIEVLQKLVDAGNTVIVLSLIHISEPTRLLSVEYAG